MWWRYKTAYYEYKMQAEKLKKEKKIHRTLRLYTNVSITITLSSFFAANKPCTNADSHS